MRYLILAAGMGKRMGAALGGIPKCLIEIDGEPLIGRLLRQIRRCDAAADVHVVVGYRSELIEPLVENCRIVVNPFFDITGINASLWFARAAFDQPLMLIHGDVVLSDELADALVATQAGSLVAYDSSVLDPGEINVAVAGDRVMRFGVNFSGYSGAYAGVLKLSSHAARLFAETLDRRVRRGFNEARSYYFFAMRRLLADPGVAFAAFDLARHRWKEIDYPEDIAIARARVGGQDRADVR
ncbi:MAG TPA: NTP transferase domain-containing protein [Casimicrobiaceae bacterium]|nr:NTP transferase domain-containing protein [Casimicrobiaceae bacterium]